VNYPPPKPEVILTNIFAEPTVLLVPITSHVKELLIMTLQLKFELILILIKSYFGPFKTVYF
jgi:ABC-type transporter Mla maintaining outer membrane lipid asymmetry ATPase subunit MlaF